MRPYRPADKDHKQKMGLVDRHNTTFATAALLAYTATVTPLTLSWSNLNDYSPLLAKAAFLVVAGINIASLAFMNANMVSIDELKDKSIKEAEAYVHEHPNHSFKRS